MADDGLTALTATDAAAEIARGAISAEDYARACLDRIEALDGERTAAALMADPQLFGLSAAIRQPA